MNTRGVTGELELEPTFTSYSRAMVNILGDLTDEKARLHDMQKAMLNILADAGGEKDHLKLAQRAMLNILEDFDDRTAQAEAANRALSIANRDLEGFSYSVSHDLRAPLRAIDGFSRILLDDYADKLDAEGQRVLNVVRESALKMGRMIDDILAFSRAGRLEMKFAPVDMEALVRQTLTDLLAAAVGRELPIRIGTLPPAHGDRAMLQHVWQNLIDNAIKFTASKPEARIEIGATARDGATVYYVRDTGAGFDMRYADKLFGVFQRLHGAEFPGSGIGLAIIKRIVERHGGQVWAEGEVGHGASFYFALPIKEAVR